MPSTASAVAALIRQLSAVTVKTEFGNQTFLVGGTRFAAVTPVTLLLHLPSEELTEALVRGLARPFVSVGAMGRHSWVEVRLSAIGEDDLHRLIGAAHQAALHSHRRSAVKKPARARHVRRTTPK
jgi:hypothetical protein